MLILKYKIRSVGRSMQNAIPLRCYALNTSSTPLQHSPWTEAVALQITASQACCTCWRSFENFLSEAGSAYSLILASSSWSRKSEYSTSPTLTGLPPYCVDSSISDVIHVFLRSV